MHITILRIQGRNCVNYRVYQCINSTSNWIKQDHFQSMEGGLTLPRKLYLLVR